jgi:hypothetical protein
MKCLNESVKNFNMIDKQAFCMDQLFTSISPLVDDAKIIGSQLSKRVLQDVRSFFDGANLRSSRPEISLSNRKVFNAALYETLRKALAEQADADIAFAWRVFNADFVVSDNFGLKEKRPSAIWLVYRSRLFDLAHSLEFKQPIFKIHRAQIGVRQKKMKKKVKRATTSDQTNMISSRIKVKNKRSKKP